VSWYLRENLSSLQFLQVDTGSSNTAVPVPACTLCGKGPFFDPKSSVTATNVACASPTCQSCVPEGSNCTQCVFGQPYCAKENGFCGYGITYGGGSSGLYGSLITDQVCSGGLCGKVVFGGILNQFFFESNYDSNSTFYGILGLAYPFNACNPSCTIPIFEDISRQISVPNLFGMCLTPSSGGILDLGFIDASKYTGVMSYVPITDHRWYNIGLRDIFVGPFSLGLRQFMYITTNDVIGAFVDSGTSIILLSPAAYSALQTIFETNYSYLPGIGGNHTLLNGGCISASAMGNNIPNFPPLRFVIDGFNSQSVVLSTSPQSYLMPSGVNNSEYCFGIQSVPGIGVVLGDVFMQEYYIVFDRVKNQLGFATALCQ